MYQTETIGYEEAQRAIQAILAEQAKDPDKRAISIAVADANGELIAFARMEGGRPMTGEVAMRKAYTSVRMRNNSGVAAERVKQGGMNPTDIDPKMIAAQGGVCIMKPGTQVCVGAVGVSGLAAPEDEALAEKGVQAMGLK